MAFHSYLDIFGLYEERCKGGFGPMGFIDLKNALTPHNIWKGFEMTSMWWFNIDVMTSKMHPSKKFMEMQEPFEVRDVAIEDLQIHKVL